MGVENFHHRGGNIGPPIEVEFSTIFIYSAVPQITDAGRQALTGDVYLIAGNGSVQLLVVSEQMVTDSSLTVLNRTKTEIKKWNLSVHNV